MNMRSAFRETVELAKHRGMDRSPTANASLSYAHLVEMQDRIAAADVEGKSFSEGKLGRWLGWAQAAVCAVQCAGLEEMKAINKRWSDDADK